MARKRKDEMASMPMHRVLTPPRVFLLRMAVFLMLVQFLLNLLGSMWDEAAWLRPMTIFYYYQPQQLILTGDWCVTLSEWNGGSPLVHLPMPVVLFGV